MITLGLTWVYLHYQANGDMPVGTMFLTELIAYVLITLAWRCGT